MSTSNTFYTNFKAVRTLLLRGVVFLALVFSAVSTAQADRPRAHFSGGDWRLGNHNQIFLRTDRGWQRVQGSAVAVADGWVLGTDRRNGGYGIYRWNGRNFDRMPGAAVDIGGSYERPWVINNRGERFEWAGRDWREIRTYGSHRREKNSQRHYDRHDDHDNRRRSGW